MPISRVTGAYALALSMFAAGCGTVRAATNTDALWAAKEDAPLAVVVHRAQAAKITASEVERLLTATATDDQSEWPAATQLAPEIIEDTQAELKLHPHYDGRQLRVVSALIWARELPNIQSKQGTHPSLLAAISPQLGAGYAAIEAQLAALEKAETALAKAEEALESDGLSKSEKASRKAKVDEMKVRRDAIEDRIDSMRREFAARCRAVAASVSPELREHYGVALVNLRQAVRDARTANSAAVVRYPFVVQKTAMQGLHALHTIKQDVEQAAQAAASDYVFERTGKRVLMRHFQWMLTFEDGVVSISINGMSPSDIGNISIAELVKETVSRTTGFASNALSLLVTSSSIDDRLTFEADVIGGILDGFADGGYQAPLAALEPPPGSGSGMFGHLFEIPGVGAAQPTPTVQRTQSAVVARGSSGGEAATPKPAVSGGIAGGAGSTPRVFGTLH